MALGGDVKERTFKLIESAQARWRADGAPHLVALVRAARGSRTASSSNDPTNQEAISKPRDQGGHETGRPVGQWNFRSSSAICLTGWGVWMGLRHAGWPVDELLGVAVERPALDQLQVEVGPSWKIGSRPV